MNHSSKGNVVCCKSIIMLFLFLIYPLKCQCAVIFEESFDQQADWNVTNQYTNECSDECSTAPLNWSNHRTVPGDASLPNPTGSIRRLPGNLPDHTSGAGKAYVVYNQSVSEANWPGDSILAKVFAKDHNELFIRFWMRTQTGWQTVAGAQSKVFRVFHWDRRDNIFQFAAHSSPIFFWDLAASAKNFVSYVTAYRCHPQPPNYYCTAPGIPSYQTNDTFYPFGFSSPTSSGAYADGRWHRYDFHVKINDIGANNGIMEWWYDGKRMESRTNVQWKAKSGSSEGIGWNAFAIGGNSNNTFTPRGEQWYAVDDVVVSTTPIP